METSELILLGVSGGAVVWFVLRKPTPATAPVQPPCAVGYQGVTVTCSAVGKALNAVGSAANQVSNTIGGAVNSVGRLVTGGGSVNLAQAVADANKRGVIYEPQAGWHAETNRPLPAGYLNYVTADGKGVYQGPVATGGKWIATAQPRLVNV